MKRQLGMNTYSVLLFEDDSFFMGIVHPRYMGSFFSNL